MKRIIVHFADGDYVNVEGDRLEIDEERNMIYAYYGKNLVGAFEIDSVIRVYISTRRGDCEL